MFLVTSADQRYWDKSQEILFLHEGCITYSKKNDLKDLRFSILPYPQEKPEKIINDAIYIEKLCKKILPILSRDLNKIHNIEHSEKYWKIILYPWLFVQAYLLYDRYLQIKYLKTSNLVTDTYVLKCTDLSKLIPLYPFPNRKIIQLYEIEEYNQYIYGRIIEITNALPYTVVDYIPDIPAYPKIDYFSVDSSNKKILKKICIAINELFASSISIKYNKIQIIRSYMAYSDIIKLNIKLKQFPSIIENIPVELDEERHSIKLRNLIKEDLQLSLTDSEFERLFSILIPEILPKIYLENFKQIFESIHKLVKKTTIVYAAAGFYDPEILFYAAEICERNDGKIITTQHGPFGTVLYNPFETIQKEISDIFLSWGWTDNSYQNVIAMPTASKFNYIKEIAKCKNNFGKILLIEASSSRGTRGFGMLAPFSYPNYIDNQFSFYEHLSKDAKKLLNIRMFPNDYWDLRVQWADKYPDADTDSKGKSFYDLLKDCRLAINSTNDTTFYECLVGNIPTILFHNPKYEIVRPSAQQYFDMLHNVGIIHYTPESAAKLVNEIYKDPMKWWMQQDIQEAKYTFCHHFARTSDDALDQLSKFLKEESDKIAK